MTVATGPLRDSTAANLSFFLRSITPLHGDPTYSVLKAHLLFEDLLRDAVFRRLPRPEALQGSRLTFKQLLALAMASVPASPVGEWVWEGVDRLNRLRNLLAHHLEAPAAKQRIDDLVAFVVKSGGVPLPPPAAESTGAATDADEPGYLAIDVALGGLYGLLAHRLGFDARSRLSAEQGRTGALIRRE